MAWKSTTTDQILLGTMSYAWVQNEVIGGGPSTVDLDAFDYEKEVEKFERKGMTYDQAVIAKAAQIIIGTSEIEMFPHGGGGWGIRYKTVSTTRTAVP